MDSLTQAALGAAVGEAVLGRRIGNKGMAWGAVVGTLPDLDVIAYPFLDEVGELVWHRGLSHSVLIAVVAAIAGGWLLHRVNRSAGVTWARAGWAVGLIWSTHILIDVFTVYGTQVWEPFSHYRAAIGNLFIIDPLFTLPLLLGLGVALLRRFQGRRSSGNRLGLAVCTAYAAWSLVSHSVAVGRFERSLAEQGIDYEHLAVGPTPFNTLLWRGLAQTRDGTLLGYTSHLDEDGPIQFEFIDRGSSYLEGIDGSPAVQCLIWFSKGFYSVAEDRNGIVFNDLRFGEIRQTDLQDTQFMFSWRLSQSEEGEWGFETIRPEISDARSVLRSLVRRVLGDPSALGVARERASPR